MRLILALVALSCPAWAGYAVRATLTFPAPTGSHTNFTAAFTFSDAKFATVANGGRVANTVTRVGVTVPADFIITSDSTCNTLAGSYTWGVETYSATTGVGIGWVQIPTYSAGVTAYICAGNAAVSTYQGGAVGAEFDSNTKGAWHLSDGTTLSVKDSSSSANDGTSASSPSAVTGKIDGGAGLASGSKITTTSTGFAAGSARRSISGWFKTSYASGPEALFGYGSGTTAANYLIGVAYGTAGKIYFAGYSADVQGVATVNDGIWHHVAATYDGTTVRIYVDGAPDSSGALALNTGAGGMVIGANTWSGADVMTGSVDEIRFAATDRSANWIVTEYGNQNSPPAASAATLISTGSQPIIF
jgi:hypothetical protein